MDKYAALSKRSAQTQAAVCAGADDGGRASAPQRAAFALLLTAFLLGTATPARAADGCLVLLCLAAPSWSSIAQCVDPVRRSVHDLAHGRPFPAATCRARQQADQPVVERAGLLPAAVHDRDRARERHGLPVRVRRRRRGRGRTASLWAAHLVERPAALGHRVQPAAKASLGTWDTRFDDDYAAWSRPVAGYPRATAC